MTARRSRLRALARRLREAAARLRARRATPRVRLEAVRRRLEIFLTALHDQPMWIEHAAPAPRRRGIRLLDRVPRHLRTRVALAATDGTRIHLPEEIEAPDGEAAAIGIYRLLAVEQAERLARGTAAHAPSDDALARDLYLLHESVAVDRRIARVVPGLAPALAASRASALAARPPLDRLRPAEREVERLVRDALAGDVTAADDEPGDVAGSLRWAEEQARRIGAAGGRGAYRGVAPVSHWGTVVATPEAAPPPRPRRFEPLVAEQRGADPIAFDAAGQGGEGDGGTGQSGSDGMRRQEDDGREPGTGRLAEDVAAPGADESGEARGQAVADRAGATGAEHSLPERPVAAEPADTARYPEWDVVAGRYQRDAVTVHRVPPAEADAAPVASVLRESAPLVRRVRQQFEHLRARRIRLTQQRDGDDLDLAACVRALVDLRGGRAPDDRLYVAVHPARRGLAITLLVDASGSTVTPAGGDGGRRVIDLEKLAVALASEALESLGDRYAVLAFSGKRAAGVRVTTVKDFGERAGERLHRRLAAVEPQGYTRLGAAVRHAAAGLAREPAGHRLLLILSDGRPNDADMYQGEYALEDTRRAVLEARAGGAHVFCLTIDREEPEYLVHLFGPGGYTILMDPDQLPRALLGVVRRLLTS